MKNTLQLLPFIIILSLIFIYTQDCFALKKRSNIAVAGFELIGGFDASEHWYARAFTEELTGGLSRLNNVNILERSSLEKVTGEIALQLSGLTSEASGVTVGQILGADKLITGNLSKFEQSLRVNCRIIDIETGQILKAFEVTGAVTALFSLKNTLLKQIIDFFEQSDSPRIDSVSIDLDNQSYQTLIDMRKEVNNFPMLRLDPARRKNALKWMRSLNKLEAISEKYPALSEPHMLLAAFLVQLEDFTAARDHLEKARQISPDDVMTAFYEARLLYISKNYSGAKSKISRYLKSMPESSAGWYIYGKSCLKTADGYNAASGFLNALLNSPYLYEAETNLKTLLRATEGQHILTIMDQDDPYKNWLARLFLAHWDNRQDRINRLLENTVYAANEFYLTRYLTALQHLKNKNYVQAIEDFRRALELNPSFTATHKYLGIALIEHNKKDSGIKHLQSYLALARHIDDFALINSYLKR